MAAPTDRRRDRPRRRRAEPRMDRRPGHGPSVHTDLGDVQPGPKPLSPVYKAVMFGLMILGLLWICTYYLTQGLFPILQLGGWNLAIGFGLALVGFLMMSRWSE